MSISFTESTQQARRFFEILPPDWQESIVPFWADYQDTTRVFILETATEVIGGGMVFSTVSPDTQVYKEVARQWLDAGYLYIGFLLISERYRNQKLGAFWLSNVLNHFPNRAFWLSIEEPRLLTFYERNGFKFIRKIKLESHDEWILATKN